MFNRHRIMVESEEVDADFSRIYFFLPSITDCSEEVNQYLKNVSITPLDITQEQLNVWAQNSHFDPAKLDMYGGGKKE